MMISNMQAVCLLLSVCALAVEAGDVRSSNLVGGYHVRIIDEKDARSHIQITQAAGAAQNLFVWSTSPQLPFLRLGNASIPRPPILDGNYQLEEYVIYVSDEATIDSVVVDKPGLSVDVSGRLLDSSAPERTKNVATYKLTFSVADTHAKQIKFDIAIKPNEVYKNARVVLTYVCENDENFYGFGESFSYFNLKGRRVPVLVSEQGVGRGEQPITDTLNTDVAQGVGGTWYTTYAPKPVYITNYNRTVMLNNSEVSFFNLTATAVNDRVSVPSVQVEVWSLHITGYIMQSSSMLGAIEAVTEITGRQTGLPLWTQKGAIVGLEGGTANVTKIVDSMYAAGVPMAGIWLQDWVGLQHSWDGDRLIWNWELNNDHYPGWNDMVTKWDSRGTRVLTYMSPFFSDPSAYSTSTTAFRHNFFQEGVANGYFVQNANHSTYMMYSLSIKFAMLDLTNPAAVAWMKDIIINQSVEEAHSSGWMCDFGEYLPFDAVLHSGERTASFHNRYPEEWGALTKSALVEAARRRAGAAYSSVTTPTSTLTATVTPASSSVSEGTVSPTVASPSLRHNAKEVVAHQLAPIDPNDVMFFMRSAWLQSPRYAPVFWLGDQLVSWDSNDGLRSALIGALSSGLVGHAVTHSDIGGYTVETTLGDDMYYVRTPELLKRWSEFGAFGFGLFRTHIGSSTTSLDAQVYDSPESMAHFAEFAGIYAQLSGYRQELLQEAAETGHPLVRHMCLHYGYDAAVWDLSEQYLVGTQFLAAPCLYEGATTVNVYFPQYSGSWVHIWSGNVVTPTDPTQGLTVTVPAPIGFPPVFYQQGSQHGEELRAYLLKQGYTAGYHWDYSETSGGSTLIGSGHGQLSGKSDNALDYIIPVLIVLVLTAVAVALHCAKVAGLWGRKEPPTRPRTRAEIADEEVNECLLNSELHL